MPHSVVVAPDGHEVPCENTREDVFKEIDIICGLEHDNIVYLKEYFEEHNKYDGPNRSWAMKGHVTHHDFYHHLPLPPLPTQYLPGRSSRQGMTQQSK
mmetsp:Transcript_16239/g.48361  ORF Transcript_16239/g.48361 Transcript_16239/m.48361 type:complete len:98 (+) Transcript_16239:1117-1410(+)